MKLDLSFQRKAFIPRKDKGGGQRYVFRKKLRELGGQRYVLIAAGDICYPLPSIIPRTLQYSQIN